MSKGGLHFIFYQVINSLGSYKKVKLRLGVVVKTFNRITQEAEACGYLGVQGQLCLHRVLGQQCQTTTIQTNKQTNQKPKPKLKNIEVVILWLSENKGKLVFSHKLCMPEVREIRRSYSLEGSPLRLGMVVVCSSNSSPIESQTQGNFWTCWLARLI